MADASARHIVDEELPDPASYLTIRQGDPVYDLYGWAAGRVAEVRIAPTRDEHFDGLVVDFRGELLFVDAPEVRAIHEGVVWLGLTVADLTRAMRDPATPEHSPGGPRRAPTRAEAEAAMPDDAIALIAAVSRLYVAGRLSIAALERELERVLSARTCGHLDAIAGELLPATTG